MGEQANAAPTRQPFQAEVAQLLKLMVHLVYSEADIFLRRLNRLVQRGI
jgi:HSP90 family molecular chaperone